MGKVQANEVAIAQYVYEKGLKIDPGHLGVLRFGVYVLELGSKGHLDVGIFGNKNIARVYITMKDLHFVLGFRVQSRVQSFISRPARKRMHTSIVALDSGFVLFRVQILGWLEPHGDWRMQPLPLFAPCGTFNRL